MEKNLKQSQEAQERKSAAQKIKIYFIIVWKLSRFL